MPLLSWLTLLLVVLVVGAFAWTAFVHLWLGLPYVPTPDEVVRAMVNAAALRGDETVMDLGAGDARTLIAVKRAFPGITAIGYELVSTIWLIGKINILFSRQSITWLRNNALLADVSQADAIFLYVTPAYMQKLETKFNAELQPGTRVISHAFRFKNRTPASEQKVQLGRSKKTVLVYQW